MSPPAAVRQLGLFITESCNLACPYCFAANMEGRFMPAQLARRALELVLGPDNSAMQVGVTFWGGEPLLRFELLQELVLHARQQAQRHGKRLLLALPTNVTLLTDEVVNFLQQHEVRLSLSLDGGAAAQGLRRTHGGQSSYEVVLQKLELVARRYPDRLPPVRMTITPQTAGELYHNVRFFLDRGFGQVYFAPVAEAAWGRAELEQLAAGQLRLAELWLERLEAGQALPSFPAWDKVLARRELVRRGQLPAGGRGVSCGAGSAMLAVDIHGDIYPCHRFVFYDKQRRGLRLGHVDQGLPEREHCAAVARVDSARLGTDEQRCAACHEAERCFNVCPALNYALGGEVHRVDRRLCRLMALDHDVADQIERRALGTPAYERYMEQRLLRTYGPSGLSATMAALFERLDQDDEQRLAQRAEQIMARIQRGRGGGDER